MKANIEVANRKEADAIRAGLDDPSVRAFVIIMGTLLMLPNQRARIRVLTYVKDRLEENAEIKSARETSAV